MGFLGPLGDLGQGRGVTCFFKGLTWQAQLGSSGANGAPRAREADSQKHNRPLSECFIYFQYALTLLHMLIISYMLLSNGRSDHGGSIAPS